MISLRGYQDDGRGQIRHAYRSGYRSVLYVLPTGGGKTRTALSMVEGALLRGRRVLAMVHRTEIMEQISMEASGFGLPHGVIGPGYVDELAPFQVGMVQSLAQRIKRDPDRYRYDFIWIDEAHHATFGTQYETVMQNNPGTYILGVTATPERLDGRGLRESFEHMVIGPPPSWMIQEKYLCEPVLISSPRMPEIQGLHARAGDVATAENEAMFDRKEIAGDAIQAYRQYTGGAPSVAFCTTVKHCHHVAEQFNQAGYQWGVLVGTTPREERQRIRRDLTSGALNGVSTVDVVSEGYDLPGLVSVIQLAHTRSLQRCLQQWGRMMRGGKPRGFALDHARNHELHWHPAIDREWSLDSTARRRKRKPEDEDNTPTTRCKECGCVFMRSILQCPECGLVLVVKERKVEVDPTAKMEEIRAEQFAKMEERRKIGRMQTLAELQAYAKEKGYKPGWAYHRYQARQSKQRTQA